MVEGERPQPSRDTEELQWLMVNYYYRSLMTIAEKLVYR